MAFFGCLIVPRKSHRIQLADLLYCTDASLPLGLRTLALFGACNDLMT